jgi:hypothetical protein
VHRDREDGDGAVVTAPAPLHDRREETRESVGARIESSSFHRIELGLPGSDFKSPKARHELAGLLREILDAVKDRRSEEAESKIRRALGDLGGIRDDAAEDSIEAALKAALGALDEGPEEKHE